MDYLQETLEIVRVLHRDVGVKIFRAGQFLTGVGTGRPPLVEGRITRATSRSAGSTEDSTEHSVGQKPPRRLISAATLIGIPFVSVSNSKNPGCPGRCSR